MQIDPTLIDEIIQRVSKHVLSEMKERIAAADAGRRITAATLPMRVLTYNAKSNAHKHRAHPLQRRLASSLQKGGLEQNSKYKMTTIDKSECPSPLFFSPIASQVWMRKQVYWVKERFGLKPMWLPMAGTSFKDICLQGS